MESKLTVFLTELSFCTVSGSNSKFLILNEFLLYYFIMQSWHFSHINRITEKKRLRNTSFLNDHFAGTCTISHLSQWWTRVKVVSLFVLLLRCPNSRIRLSGAVGQYWFTGVTFPVRCTLMVLCFITQGKNKGLLFRTWPEKIIILNNNFRDFLLTEDSVCFADCIWRRKDALQLLPLVLKSGAGVHGQDPVVFLCFFKHSIPTRSLQCLWQFIPQSGRQRKC